jgi:hypothetical protein
MNKKKLLRSTCFLQFIASGSRSGIRIRDQDPGSGIRIPNPKPQKSLNPDQIRIRTEIRIHNPALKCSPPSFENLAFYFRSFEAPEQTKLHTIFNHELEPYTHDAGLSNGAEAIFISEPTSQDAKPRVQPGVHPPLYITNVEGELRVKLGAWRPEMWALANSAFWKKTRKDMAILCWIYFGYFKMLKWRTFPPIQKYNKFNFRSGCPQGNSL